MGQRRTYLGNCPICQKRIYKYISTKCMSIYRVGENYYHFKCYLKRFKEEEKL